MKKIKFLALSAFAALALLLAGCDNGASLDDDSGTDTTQISDSGNTEKESSGDEKTDTTTNEVESPAATYTVTISDKITHGSVSISKLTDLKADDTVTITITPDTDYVLDTLIVKDASGNTVTTTDNTFKMPSGNVTVTATFKWKYPYFGNKAASEAKEVGDIVFNDGSAIAYSSELLLTDEQKEAAIAVIFFKGSDLNSNDDDTSRTLGVGLKHSKLAWCRWTDENDIEEFANAYNTNIDTIQCTPDNGGRNGNYTWTGNQDKNGSDNLTQIAEKLGTEKNDTGTATNYPAFYFAINYKDTATNLGTTYADGWYLPTLAELFQIWKNKTDVDTASEALGGNKFGTSIYWSSSQDTRTEYASKLDFSDGACSYISNKKTNNYVCAIHEF